MSHKECGGELVQTVYTASVEGTRKGLIQYTEQQNCIYTRKKYVLSVHKYIFLGEMLQAHNLDGFHGNEPVKK